MAANDKLNNILLICTFISIEFYGLQKPSNKLVNLIGDIIVEKKNLVKLSKCYQILRNSLNNNLLKDLGISYQLVNSDQKSLIENAFKINETAAELFIKAKSSWNKIFRNSIINNNANTPLPQKNNTASATNMIPDRRNTCCDLLKTSSFVNSLLNKNNEENSNSSSRAAGTTENNCKKEVVIVQSGANNDTSKSNNSNDAYNNYINNNNISNNNRNKIFGENSQNTSFDFSNVDLKLIYEFSDKVNLTEIYPAFSKISNISKNFAEDMIEYCKILKNNDIIVLTQEDERKKIIIIPELNQYCFYITVINKKLNHTLMAFLVLILISKQKIQFIYYLDY